MQTIDDIDGQLLNRIQGDFPVVARPFQELGTWLNLSEADVIDRIGRMKADRVIRQISAIFDTRQLGYKSSLVAMQVPRERVDEAGAIINQHPGVSHNYRRNHTYNLWFTIAVPPSVDIARTVELIGEDARATATRLMPTLRLFKIGVDLDMTGERGMTARGKPEYDHTQRERENPPLTAREIAVIRELQEDIPLISRPFQGMAQRLGVSETELFAEAQALADSARLRRFAAILHHREAGYKANAMAVWIAPEERILECGTRMASFRAVSHCYQRPVYPDWPYNLFGMIHGRSAQDCQETVEAIKAETGMTEYAMLYSSKEYKKTRVRYFSPELDEWQERHAPHPVAVAGA
jgi:siroheme decarboxylase